MPETQPQSEPSALRSASTRYKEEFLDSIANADYIVKKEVTFDVAPLEVNSQKFTGVRDSNNLPVRTTKVYKRRIMF